MGNLCQDKYKDCPFVPNMEVKKDDIALDEYGLKHRKVPKIFKCLYDNHILRWDLICPREVIEVNSHEQQDD